MLGCLNNQGGSHAPDQTHCTAAVRRCCECRACFDNGSTTVDTGTGLEWLDLTETQGLSYNQVLAQTGAGGLFAGYRFAEAYEVETLFDNAGGTGPYLGSDPSHDAFVPGLLSLWGVTLADPAANLSYFLLADVNTAFDEQYYGQLQETFAGDDFARVNTGLSRDRNDANALFGSALVRNVVPVPAAVWLFASALAGLGWMGRRQVR